MKRVMQSHTAPPRDRYAVMSLWSEKPVAMKRCVPDVEIGGEGFSGKAPGVASRRSGECYCLPVLDTTAAGRHEHGDSRPAAAPWSR